MNFKLFTMTSILNPTLLALITFVDQLYNSGIIETLGFQTILGTPQQDIIQGTSKKDFIRGFQGNDSFSGGGNFDVLDGGAGNDILKGEGGNDLLVGDFDLEDFTMSGNDFLDGGDGNDILVGWLGSDNLKGGAGMDFLFGDIPFLSALIPADSTTNDDTLCGNEGNDFLFGGRGNDILNGGGDNDILVGDEFAANPATLNSFLGFAQALLLETPFFDLQTVAMSLSGILTIEDVSLDGALNNDTLRGGTGDDILLAGNGNDILVGGDGSDVLVGFYGNNRLTGGTGSDSFVLSIGNVTNGIVNVDRITDFNVNEDHLIVIGPVLHSGISGDIPITPEQLVIGTAATEMDDRFIYNDSTGTLFFDLDGSGSIAKIALAKLNAGLSLTADNILTT